MKQLTQKALGEKLRQKRMENTQGSHITDGSQPSMPLSNSTDKTLSSVLSGSNSQSQASTLFPSQIAKQPQIDIIPFPVTQNELHATQGTPTIHQPPPTQVLYSSQK